ncbi:hypothetical protein L1987_14491 [Smallanthus sonchifolius]|uniref:Uncharacterized protein n=1 Tax=Smallanthus sonchifolius TaxID=185202 RepID=A0ACB9J3K2_9ASTR|nr:hypothetical protein L1987_14491 [Smallanthus sonchifolius]
MFGYLDPDYFYTGKLTRKSDVYAFRVVLFEILCGKRAIDRSIDGEQRALAVWARDSIKEGRLKEIVDSNIRGGISPKCLKEFAQLAKRCVHKHPKQRPTMAEVVVGLESVLALQEKANNTLQPTSMKFFARKAPKVVVPSNNENSSSNDDFLVVELVIGSQNQTLHQFDLKTISVATENFSEANRISRLKTYDSLYKVNGKLQYGQGIAVAEIYIHDTHERFMNDASILVKLEHENLAKLLGYCIEETGFTLLVYEFALHTSLDRLMFDPECTLLNWDKRYKIILGVARAVLYLHRDAPIQIRHCNVKPGNILLDENMNPILSGFLDTRYIAITETYLPDIFYPWHYNAPECMYDGNESSKLDVYSLGVLILETISGHSMPHDISLLEYVGRNWLEGTLSNITEPRIDVDLSSLTRFFEIGLLCIQKDSEDRPTMEEVVSMLLDCSPLTLPVAKMRAMIIRESSNSNSAPVNDHSYNTGADDYDNSAVEEFLSDLGPR